MRKLLIQSIGAADDKYAAWMQETESVHRKYAERHGAEYLFHVGTFADASANWSRLVLMREAFDEGFDKVVWFDADVLVLQPDRDIFAETSDVVPLQMMRNPGSGERWPWRGDAEWDWFNDGVIVANNSPEARDCFAWVWMHRRSEPLEYHVSAVYEENWMLDWAYDHPSAVLPLPEYWNSWWWQEAPPEGTVVAGWHGRANAATLTQMRTYRNTLYDGDGNPR